ncbi:MAG: tryptophan synthase subunit alpha [Chloroflexota bacterium]
MTGLLHIAATFERARAEQRAAFMPYYTLGFPTPAIAVNVVKAIAASGADLIELGVPFSDPLADGPSIQHSTQVALEQGMTVARCIQAVAELRAAGVTQPFLLMGYINPILAYGVEKYVADAVSAGADGFIVPDLPPEEAAEMDAACRTHGAALVYLAAPTSTDERLAALAQKTTGFLYLVSLTGVTGERQEVSAGLRDFAARARRVCTLPLAVGFGVSTPAMARQVGEIADGVIVGSALINVANKARNPAQAAGEFVCQMRTALG